MHSESREVRPPQEISTAPICYHTEVPGSVKNGARQVGHLKLAVRAAKEIAKQSKTVQNIIKPVFLVAGLKHEDVFCVVMSTWDDDPH